MSESHFNRVLPNSREAEGSVIGAMLIDPATAKEAADMLSTDSFYYLPNSLVYAELCAMIEDGLPLDTVVLMQRLQDAKKLDEIGGPAVLSDYLTKTPTASNWRHYAEIVVAKHLQRRLIAAASDVLDSGFDTENPSNLALESAQRFAQLHAETAALLKQEDLFPFKSMRDMEQRYRGFVQRSEKSTFSLHGWLPTLARQANIRALVPGEVLVIVGDTGVGKTAIAQNLTMAAAPNPVALFELELPDSLCFERYVQMSERLHGQAVYDTYRKGEVVGWSHDRIGHIWTCDESGLSIEGIDARLTKFREKLGQPPTLTVIDYIQLLKGRGKRYERTSDAAEAVKYLAKKHETIIAVLSQVQRPEDKSASVEPGIHSAKDSGSIESSGGLVLGIHRDDKDNRKLWVKVLKNSKGRGGWKVPCLFDVETMWIGEMTDQHGTAEMAERMRRTVVRGGNDEQ